jgi:hypothetical protein
LRFAAIALYAVKRDLRAAARADKVARCSGFHSRQTVSRRRL